jgi:PadR family transcriptional regulator, regulatory protein PadR
VENRVDSRREQAYLPIDIDRKVRVAAEKLELLILKTLASASLHGYGIGQRIEQRSGGVFRVTLGSLYPALQRLEREGLIDAEWKASDNNRRARYYRITPAGRRRLAAEVEDWERVSAAVTRILKAT